VVTSAADPQRECVRNGTVSQLWKTVACRGENQRPHPQTDIIRTLSYLWCNQRGGLRTAHGWPAHRAPPRSETFRRRGRGEAAEQTITACEVRALVVIARLLGWPARFSGSNSESYGNGFDRGCLGVRALIVHHLLQIEAGFDLGCPCLADEFQVIVVNGQRGRPYP
jgi:hypothetical protein